MKAAAELPNKILLVVSFGCVLLSLVGMLDAHVAIGVALGYLVGRFIIHLQFRQLDMLGPGELPRSNFVFNMLVYTILFIAMVKISVVALISSLIGLMAYRYIFFISFQKYLSKGGLDEN